MMDFTVIVGDGNRLPCHDLLRERYSALRRDHRQTLDLLEMQDAIVQDLRAERLTLAALAHRLSRQIEHAGHQPDCNAGALALCDAVMQEEHDTDERCRCGSACNVDEGE